MTDSHTAQQSVSPTTSASAQHPLGSLGEDWREAAIPDGYRVALTGDIIIAQPVSRMIQRRSPDLADLLKRADLTVGNYEGSIIDLNDFDGYPAALSGFSWLTAPPQVAPDLARLGFDMLSRANNHATDWGVAGLASTDRHLREAGLAIAGTGSDLAGARTPALFDGVQARAGLVSFATTFQADSPAADPLGQAAGRPGVSPLHLSRVVMVSKRKLAVLRAIRDEQPPQSVPDVLRQIDERLGVVTLFGQRYVALPDSGSPSDGPMSSQTETGERTVVTYQPDKADIAGIMRGVRQAKQTTDFTVVVSHTHEPDNWTTETPAFLRSIVRKAFSEGADVFMTAGPHQLRGTEIIDGKPAFYSLGNFCFMDNTQAVCVRDEWERPLWRLAPVAVPRFETSTEAEFFEWKRAVGAFGEEIWFESVVPLITYASNGRIRTIELHPIELGYVGRDADRGIPSLPTLSQSLDILERLRQLSEPLGTDIVIDDQRGIGVIRIAADE